MKRYLKPIFFGINPKLNEETNKYEFTLDFDDNQYNDVVQFIEPYFFESKIDDDVFYFGYKFNDGVDSKLRKEFIEFMKDVKYEQWEDPEDEWSETYFESGGIKEPELKRMVIRSVNNIGLSKFDIDVIVYPQSYGNLVSSIAKCLTDYLSVGRKIPSESLVKAAPSEISFNVDKCWEGIQSNEIRVPSYVDYAYLLNIREKIANAERFSMRKLVHPPVLRKYVEGIFRPPIFKPIESADTVLIVDDFKTTGTTIKQIVDAIRSFNPDAVIYIFTLFGKTGKL